MLKEVGRFEVTDARRIRDGSGWGVEDTEENRAGGVATMRRIEKKIPCEKTNERERT